MAPQAIAHYRITFKLGQGGMGEVWSATDTKLGLDVAIKILPASLARDPERQEDPASPPCCSREWLPSDR